MFRSKKSQGSPSAQLALEVEKWVKEIEWREREISLRFDELKATRRSQWLTLASMLISALAVIGSVGAAVYVAGENTKSVQHSAQVAASSAQHSAQLAAQSALDSAQQSARATIASAESTATATRESSQRAAAAARESQERKWRSDLVEDQRKSIEGHTADYLSTLYVALDEVHAVTARAHVEGVEPSPSELREYDVRQRKNLRALQLADAKLYLENREVSFAFSSVYRALRQIDEDVLLVGKATSYSKGARMHGWCRLHLRLEQIKVTPVLDAIRAAQRREGIAAPRMNFIAPNRSRVDAVDDKVIVETCDHLRTSGGPPPSR